MRFRAVAPLEKTPTPSSHQMGCLFHVAVNVILLNLFLFLFSLPKHSHITWRLQNATQKENSEKRWGFSQCHLQLPFGDDFYHPSTARLGVYNMKYVIYDRHKIHNNKCASRVLTQLPSTSYFSCCTLNLNQIQGHSRRLHLDFTQFGNSIP